MKTIWAVMACVLAFGLIAGVTGCSRDEDHMGHDGMGGGHEEMMEHHEDMGHGEMMESEPDEHGEAMQRQHESMLKLQEEWRRAKSAIEKGEASEALGPARGMDEAARYQEDFMLHRGAENRDEFLDQSREFKSLVMRFMGYAEKGDIKSLREIAPEIDEACNSCHGSFR